MQEQQQSKARVFLVVPTNRPESLRRFLMEWRGKGGWDHLIVIEDAPGQSDGVAGLLSVSTLVDPSSVAHYSHAEIRDILGENAWIISRQDSACRCFGFLAAYWAGADYVLTLDDDCYPHYKEGDSNSAAGRTLVEHHLLCMHHRRWECSPQGNVRTRGLPYKELGEHRTYVNLGLWSGSLDLDAISENECMAKGLPNQGLTVPGGSRIISAGMYVPVSGMNLMIKREALPLFYFPLMGEGQPYSRFDDIWAGVIAKKVMDHLGWHLSVGEPWIRHERASDPQVNLQKEAPGLEANEHFWKIIDGISLWGRDPLGCLHWISTGLERLAPECQGVNRDYLYDLGRALLVWSRLFKEKPHGL